MKTSLRMQKIAVFLKPELLLLYAIILLNSFISRLLTTPVTTFGLSMGLSGFVLGLIQNGCEITCMVGRPLAGYCMDNDRRRMALLLSFCLTIVAALFYGVSKSPVAYGMARLFQGFVTAFVSSVMSALLPSAVTESRLGTVMAISTALTTLGSSYAPALSKQLFTTRGFHEAYYFTAVAAVLPLILVIVSCLKKNNFLQSQPASAAAGAKEDKKRFRWKHLASGLSTSVLPVCTIGLFANITKDINEYYVVQLGIDRGINVTSGIALAGTIAVFVGIVAGLLIDRFKPKGVLIPAFIAMVASNFLYAGATTTVTATAAAILFRIGLGSYWPALLVQCCYVLPKRKGAAIATLYFFLDCVSLLNNTLLGYLYDRVGAAEMFSIVGFINVGAIVYYILLRKFYLNKRENNAE